MLILKKSNLGKQIEGLQSSNRKSSTSPSGGNGKSTLKTFMNYTLHKVCEGLDYYCKVVSSRLSRLLMKGKFDAYVL